MQLFFVQTDASLGSLLVITSLAITSPIVTFLTVTFKARNQSANSESSNLIKGPPLFNTLQTDYDYSQKDW